jgi:opacity protein-like surface antigen
MKTLPRLLALLAVVLLVSSCDLLDSSAEEPNELGGNGTIDLTQVGNDWGVSLNYQDFGPAFQNVQEDIKVIARDNNGVCTFEATFTFDTVATLALDTLLGTQDLADDAKRMVLDAALAKYGATIDTADKDNMTLHVIVKAKVTDAGIQEFINSKGDLSKPFTIVKYNAGVGDKYEFTRSDGIRLQRTVTSKSTTDDYQVGFWLLKVIKVKEETVGSEDPLLDELVYITNHKYGLVGLEGRLKSGKPLRIVVFPPTL